MMDRVLQIISEVGAINPVAPDAEIYQEGFSSVRVLELLLALEEAFGVKIPDKEFIGARTPRDIVELLERAKERQAA